MSDPISLDELIVAFSIDRGFYDKEAFLPWYAESKRKDVFTEMFNSDRVDDARKVAYVVALFQIYKRQKSVSTKNSNTTAVSVESHRDSRPIVDKERHCVRCHNGYNANDNTPGSCRVPHVILRGSGEEIHAPDYARDSTFVYHALCCPGHLISQIMPKRRDMLIQWRGVSQACFNGQHTTNPSKVLYNFASVLPCRHPKGPKGPCDVDWMPFHGEGFGLVSIGPNDPWPLMVSRVRYPMFQWFDNLESKAREFTSAYKRALLVDGPQAPPVTNNIAL